MNEIQRESEEDEGIIGKVKDKIVERNTILASKVKKGLVVMRGRE